MGDQHPRLQAGRTMKGLDGLFIFPRLEAHQTEVGL